VGGVGKHDVAVMRKRWFCVILGVGVLAVGVLAVVTREREPVYGGRKLSEWAEMYSEGLDRTNGENQTRQAAEAIREIGTNAIPYLAKWKSYSLPAWQTAVEQQIARIPGGINSHFHLGFSDKNSKRPFYALHALIALDSQTGGTNQEIHQLMNGPEGWRFISPTNLPMLTKVFTTDKVIIVYFIGLMGTNATSAVPTLEGLLTDPELEVRRVATNALRRIRNEAMNTKKEHPTP